MQKSVMVVILCICFLGVPSYANAGASDRLPYPLDQGNTWIYVGERSNTTFTLTVSGTKKICDRKCIRIEGSDDSEYYWLIDDTGIHQTRIVQSDGVIITTCPPQKILSRDAKPEARACIKPFEGTITLEGATEKSGRIKGWLLNMVEGVTDLETPAGMFEDCLQVLSISRMNNDPGNRGVITRQIIWIDPAVGIIKWYRPEMGDTFILEDYSIREAE